MNAAFTVLLVVEWALLAWFLYDYILSLAGFLPRRRRKSDAAPSRWRKFAVLICAHNERRVIGNLVENLLALKYPRDLFDVFVIADHCADDTAAVARAAGAPVIERRNAKLRGKGYALEFGITTVLADAKHYDAIVVFDADNLAAPNFLDEMNRQIEAGAQVIQAYLDTKNPYDTWISRVIALTYHVANRTWQLARSRLGLCAALGGTGFCATRELLERVKGDPACLTDDLYYQARVMLDGVKVTWTHDTRTYDEKPLTLKPALKQRQRWMQGHFDVASRFFFAHLGLAFKRASLAHLDLALYLIQPVRTFVSIAILVLLVVLGIALPDADAAAFLLPLPAWALFAFFFIAYPIVAALVERVRPRLIVYLLHKVVFAFIWVVPIAVGFWSRRKKVWVHTEHTRALRLDKVDARAPQ